MKRLLLSLVVLAAVAATARAHFIFIVPDKDGTSAQVIFSDNLEPDDPKLLAKIGKTAYHVRDAEGKAAPIKATTAADAIKLTNLAKGPQLVSGVCNYGVLARGNTDPFLLNYYATAVVGDPAAAAAATKLHAPWEVLPLQIAPGQGGYTVLWQGKPVADAEVAAIIPGQEKPFTAKTDAKGRFELPAGAAGRIGLRARHIEKKDGKHDDKEYKEVRHYSTLVFDLPKAGGDKGNSGAAADKPKEDPAASKLLADARAARAQWAGFPGFTADAAINFDGKVHKAKVSVAPEGKVRFEGLDKDVEQWARRVLASTVSHRIDNSVSLNTPCAFLDEVVDHPQGRAIRVLNDELHSSYRIKDNQIMEVNRAMNGSRFTIEVLENKLNAENKYLSVSFVVNFWDLEKGELGRSEANHQTWTRVGKYDLPGVTKVLTATPERKAEGAAKAGISAQSLTLTNHKLLETK